MNRVKIGIDKKTELMGVLLYVSNYRKEFPNLINYNRDIEYINEIYKSFSSFSNHKTIEILNQVIEKCNFCYDAPYVLITQLNEDFSVGELLDYPFKSRLKSNPIVIEFLKSVKDFVKESGFENFFEFHKPLYEKWIQEFSSKFKMDSFEHFEEFFHIKDGKNYFINLLPTTAHKGMYYDFRDEKNYIIHFRNRQQDAIKFDENGNTSSIFCTFAMSFLRETIEKEKLQVPMAKDFEETLKTKYTPSTNLQYMCGEIAAVLECIFHDEVCPNGEKRDLKNVNSCNYDRVKKIHDIFQKWRVGKSQFTDCLQKALYLF